MKYIIVLCSLFCGCAVAEQLPEAALRNNCNSCHSVTQRIVGPAWIEVSRKYSKNGEAAKVHLRTKISKGGSGVWGAMAMPANPRITDDEKEEVINFILELDRVKK